MTLQQHENRCGGFTLIELLVVVAVIAILAGIGIPRLIAARVRANESATIQMLKTILTTQQRIKVGREIDTDRDSAGEYGFLQELGGTRGIRIGSPTASGEGPLRITPLSTFGMVEPDGIMNRSGYLFRVYLPGAAGAWLGEDGPQDPYPPVSSNWAEGYWAIYAWPQSYEYSGIRTFFLNQNGDILGCSNRTRYSGRGGAPAPTAVLDAAAAMRTSMNHSVAVSSTGVDGNFWTVIN